jgi:hypothetical protein
LKGNDAARKKLLLIILITLPFLPALSKLDYVVMDYKDGASAAVCITFDWEDDYPHSIYTPERIADLKGDFPLRPSSRPPHWLHSGLPPYRMQGSLAIV